MQNQTFQHSYEKLSLPIIPNYNNITNGKQIPTKGFPKSQVYVKRLKQIKLDINHNEEHPKDTKSKVMKSIKFKDEIPLKIESENEGYNEDVEHYEEESREKYSSAKYLNSRSRIVSTHSISNSISNIEFPDIHESSNVFFHLDNLDLQQDDEEIIETEIRRTGTGKKYKPPQSSRIIQKYLKHLEKREKYTSNIISRAQTSLTYVNNTNPIPEIPSKSIRACHTAAFFNYQHSLMVPSTGYLQFGTRKTGMIAKNEEQFVLLTRTLKTKTPVTKPKSRNTAGISITATIQYEEEVDETIEKVHKKESIKPQESFKEVKERVIRPFPAPKTSMNAYDLFATSTTCFKVTVTANIPSTVTIAYKAFTRIVSNVILIQGVARVFLAKRVFKRKLIAIVIIQRWMRLMRIVMAYNDIKDGFEDDLERGVRNLRFLSDEIPKCDYKRLVKTAGIEYKPVSNSIKDLVRFGVTMGNSYKFVGLSLVSIKMKKQKSIVGKAEAVCVQEIVLAGDVPEEVTVEWIAKELGEFL